MASANGRVELADLRDAGGRRLLFDMREARENYAQGWGSSSGSRWGMRPADLLAALAVPPGGATAVEHGTGVYHGRGPRLAIASRQHIWLMDARYLRAPVHHWRTPLLSEPIDNAPQPAPWHLLAFDDDAKSLVSVERTSARALRYSCDDSYMRTSGTHIWMHIPPAPLPTTVDEKGEHAWRLACEAALVPGGTFPLAGAALLPPPARDGGGAARRVAARGWSPLSASGALDFVVLRDGTSSDPGRGVGIASRRCRWPPSATAAVPAMPPAEYAAVVERARAELAAAGGDADAPAGHLYLAAGASRIPAADDDAEDEDASELEKTLAHAVERARGGGRRGGGGNGGGSGGGGGGDGGRRCRRSVVERRGGERRGARHARRGHRRAARRARRRPRVGAGQGEAAEGERVLVILTSIGNKSHAYPFGLSAILGEVPLEEELRDRRSRRQYQVPQRVEDEVFSAIRRRRDRQRGTPLAQQRGHDADGEHQHRREREVHEAERAKGYQRARHQRVRRREHAVRRLPPRRPAPRDDVAHG